MSNLFHPVYKDEQERLEAWASNHASECPMKYHGAIGGAFTYSLAPTSLGTVTKVECACGAKFDATNYDWW